MYNNYPYSLTMYIIINYGVRNLKSSLSVDTPKLMFKAIFARAKQPKALVAPAVVLSQSMLLPAETDWACRGNSRYWVSPLHPFRYFSQAASWFHMPQMFTLFHVWGTYVWSFLLWLTVTHIVFLVHLIIGKYNKDIYSLSHLSSPYNTPISCLLLSLPLHWRTQSQQPLGWASRPQTRPWTISLTLWLWAWYCNIITLPTTPVWLFCMQNVSYMLPISPNTLYYFMDCYLTY